MDQQLLSLSQITALGQLYPAWSTLAPADLHLERLTGITNITMKASHTKDPVVKQMIVRKFGSAEQCIYLDRERQDLIIAFLSSSNLGPKLYGFNKQIRLEEFIPSKPLESSKTLDAGVLVRIGNELAKFHSLSPDFLPKTPLMQSICTDGKYLLEASRKWDKPIFTNSENLILANIRTWLCVEELSWFNQTLKQLGDRVVFSHNDLLIGNILVKPDNSIVFIDYEYSCYNYETFDFGNYFLESMYDYDVKEWPYFTIKSQFPGEREMRRMIVAYLVSGVMRVGSGGWGGTEEEVLKVLCDEELTAEFVEKAGEEMEARVEKLLRGTLYHMMSSCVYWGIWSIYMSKNPKINFDYVEFCQTRMRLYYQLKDRLTKK